MELNDIESEKINDLVDSSRDVIDGVLRRFFHDQESNIKDFIKEKELSGIEEYLIIKSIIMSLSANIMARAISVSVDEDDIDGLMNTVWGDIKKLAKQLIERRENIH